MRDLERSRHVALGTATRFIIVLLFAACERQGALTTAPQGLEPAAKPAPIDLSGTWAFTETAFILLPEELLLGDPNLAPEGKVTYARCKDSGIITLVQTGATFEGTTEQVGTCTTRGGQVFPNDSPGAFPILNGRIAGRSIHFDFAFPFCPYSGVLTVEDGIAIGMKGTGKCDFPGPRFHFKSIRWEATRVGG